MAGQLAGVGVLGRSGASRVGTWRGAARRSAGRLRVAGGGGVPRSPVLCGSRHMVRRGRRAGVRREGCSGVGEQGWSGSGGSREQREEEGGREKEKGNGEKKMRKREKEKEKGEGKKRKRGDASAPTAAIGRAWPTGGRAARDGTPARKERELRPAEKGTTVEIGCQDSGTKFREGIK